MIYLRIYQRSCKRKRGYTAPLYPESKSLKNKLTGILLLFCLIAPILSMFGWFYYQKEQVRKEVKQQILAGIPQEELTLLKFNPTDLYTKVRWKEENEIEFNHQMYDVVASKKDGDTTYYWCWRDNNETKINRYLNDLVANTMGHNPQNRNNQKRLTQFFKSLYFSKIIDSKYLETRKIKKYSPNTFEYLSTSFPPPVPPPKFI